jgi:NAD(P)-dependent dehydrogenase (short-subunit alcohol dehydrogenase family)
MAKLLDGDSALVTGAAGGIGRGIAAALKEEGATVFGADLPEADPSRPRKRRRRSK